MIDNENAGLDEQILSVKQRVAYLKDRVKDQQDAISRWRDAGVDPEVNTDYCSSERQWEREYEELDELERRLAEASAELQILIRRRKEQGPHNPTPAADG